MQAWLTIEYDNIVVPEMPFHSIAESQLYLGLQRRNHELFPSLIDYEIGPASFLAFLHAFLKELDISASDYLIDSDNLGHVFGNDNFIRPKVRIRRNDSPGREIGPLAGQILPETALLALQPVTEGFDLLILELVDRQARGIPIDVLAPVRLQEVPLLGYLENIFALVDHRLVYLLVQLYQALDVHGQVVLVGQG